MNSERHVSLFRNGRNQAVRIPREFELEGTEAIIRTTRPYGRKPASDPTSNPLTLLEG